ncbi:hypothetical protein Q0590_18165 [Rhodocytophaga aerolata]|uniref:Cbb3-type cytochrome c oxidase subunit I n=1 Tax=Rhodocytophaga aerolata TaxID=455078 RepID=A0ABT8R7X5_9BACT|nr:hypothetical protein [Rhodocytophaga aerolata]MDO1448205.1 hypothetical protein [Rhodocytophaga aerolata]
MQAIRSSDNLLFRRWALLSFFWFVVAGSMGAFLRLQLFNPVVDINYKHFLHGHSHLAFLGWVFNALFVSLIYAYIPAHVKRYQLLFWLLQVSVLGMLISFPIQGYKAISITFSTLHIFLSYWFTYQFLKDVRRETALTQKHLFSLPFVQWSLFFMVLSSIGPFALGAIIANGLAGTSYYQLAIYFYLHFQYDGWFTFAVFGLFFWWLEQYKVPLSQNLVNSFLRLMAFSCLSGYAISTLWTHPPFWVYGLAALAAISQPVALLLFVRLIYPERQRLKILLGKLVFYLTVFASLAFGIKTIMQLFSTLPAIADLAYMVRSFTIGYLHLIFLGMVTVFLIAWFSKLGFLTLSHRFSGAGIILLLLGFTGSEVYLFLQPLFFMYGLGAIPSYFSTLFIFSILMPVGAALLLATAVVSHKPTKTPAHFSVT